jgi:hypothetical protein
MASTSETGHAKNIANANLLNTYIIQIGEIYKPTNPKLLLTNLQSIYAKSFAQQENVNSLIAPYSIAVDNRELVFAPTSKKITKLQKAYKVTEGVTKAQLEDFMTIARKLKGVRKVNNKPATDAAEQQVHHSTSQMSYDQRTNNMDLLIAQLQNTPNYNPNEEEYKVTTLQSDKNKMLQATQEVANKFAPLTHARNTRNKTLYTSEDNLVEIFSKAKDYIFTILDSSSVLYKTISKIKFKKG